MTLSLKLVVGSTRPGRAADRVLPWLTGELTADERFDVEVLDLREWKLPFFQEHAGSIGDPSAPTYSEPVVKRWNEAMATGDVFVVLTPEYNHSIPGELKNALDSLYLSHALRNKPLGVVAYTGSHVGGARAVEHLVHVAQNFECVALRSTVLIPTVMSTFDDAGGLTTVAPAAALDVMRDDLAWWGEALAGARAAGELAHPFARLHAATTRRTADR
ncbi:MAG: NADPH-dependent FMN reductase [Desertimonas sp.]